MKSVTKLLPQIKGDDVDRTKEQSRDPRAQVRLEKRHSPERQGRKHDSQDPRAEMKVPQGG